MQPGRNCATCQLRPGARSGHSEKTGDGTVSHQTWRNNSKNLFWSDEKNIIVTLVPYSCTFSPSWVCAVSPSSPSPPSSAAAARIPPEENVLVWDCIQKFLHSASSPHFCLHPTRERSVRGCYPSGDGAPLLLQLVGRRPPPPRRRHTGVWPRSRARWKSALISSAAPSGPSSGWGDAADERPNAVIQRAANFDTAVPRVIATCTLEQRAPGPTFCPPCSQGLDPADSPGEEHTDLFDAAAWGVLAIDKSGRDSCEPVFVALSCSPCTGRS